MATVRTVKDTLVTIVESVTTDTVYDSVKSFVHDKLTYDPEDAKDHQSPTRRFVVVPTGEREAGGAYGASGSPIHVTQLFEVSILYRMGSTGSELFRVIAEDIDRIGFEMLRPAQWNQSTSGIARSRAGSYTMELDEGGPNGSAVVTMPLEVFYKPSFTG